MRQKVESFVNISSTGLAFLTSLLRIRFKDQFVV